MSSQATEASHIDDAVYEDLVQWDRIARSQEPAGDRALSDEVAGLLFYEARLLDARSYRKWLELFTEDLVYWVPGSRACTDPRSESAIVFDDRRHLLDRIGLIETGFLTTQSPSSQTCRAISNVEAQTLPDGSIAVHSVCIIWEYRRGKTNRFVGRQTHQLVRDGHGLRIRRRLLRLIDCDEPQGNITFIL